MCYRRTAFLREAVASVLAQTLPRERVEVLVTKDFASAPIDRFLAENGVNATLDDDPHIGPWMWRAISRTRAPLIAFLDDDDLYAPDRLAHVLKVFDEHPDLGYYRNRVLSVDAQGQPLPPKLWGRHEIDAELDRSGPVYVAPEAKESALPTLRRAYPLFNSSSIVIRRELLRGELVDRFQEVQNPDPFLFLAGVVSPFGLYLDRERLTKYRRHPENITTSVWAGEHGFQDSVALADLAARLAPPGYAEWFRGRSVNVHKYLWTKRIVEQVRVAGPRRRPAQLAVEYLRFLDRHPGQRRWDGSTWAAIGYAAGYLVAPSFTRRIRGVSSHLRTYE
jgi:glycosyltransferase involved in cell wall biosynthesis